MDGVVPRRALGMYTGSRPPSGSPVFTGRAAPGDFQLPLHAIQICLCL